MRSQRARVARLEEAASRRQDQTREIVLIDCDPSAFQQRVSEVIESFRRRGLPEPAAVLPKSPLSLEAWMELTRPSREGEE